MYLLGLEIGYKFMCMVFFFNEPAVLLQLCAYVHTAVSGFKTGACFCAECTACIMDPVGTCQRQIHRKLVYFFAYFSLRYWE